MYRLSLYIFFFFFFNDTATTEIYTLSLHDALPILPSADMVNCPVPRTWENAARILGCGLPKAVEREALAGAVGEDRKSTRLNSSHSQISYAVFCLKKKKNNSTSEHTRIQLHSDSLR